MEAGVVFFNIAHKKIDKLSEDSVRELDAEKSMPTGGKSVPSASLRGMVGLGYIIRDARG